MLGDFASFQSYRQFIQQADECLAACQAYVVQTRSQQVSYAASHGVLSTG
ncbi:hypothetical protein [Piscirickettsia salmonis]|nr:hypothetical protein [Piscirickettsia salmonis]